MGTGLSARTHDRAAAGAGEAATGSFGAEPLTTATRRRPPRVEIPAQMVTGGRLAPYMAGLALEHGPIFAVVPGDGPLAGRRVVYLVGPEANRMLLVTHGHRFSHEFGWSPVFGPAIGEGLINSDPPAHPHFRSVMAPAFTRSMMDRYGREINAVVRERTSDWAERGRVDLVEESRRIAFDVAAAALLGASAGEVDVLRERFYALVHGPTAPQTATARGRAAVDSDLLALVASRRAAPPDAPPTVLDLLLRGGDERGAPVSDECLLGHIDILLLAGYETTTNLAAWVLYLLAVNPGWSERVDAELATAGDPSHAHVATMAPVLTNVVREAGRLHPPVNFVPRVAVEDFEFGGCLVQAGTPIRLCVAAGHRLPTLFSAPDTFDPGRFAPPRQEQRRHPHALVTFGAGPRTCLGLNLALMEVKLLAAHVQRHYRLAPERSEIEQIDTVVHYLPSGIWVRVEKRGGAR